jgi:hypothetical protein
MLNSLIVQAVGSMGLFASRAFVPAFAAALILRVGPELPWVHDLGLLGLTGIDTAPSWFTSDLSLIILGVLATLEVMSTKNADARELLSYVDKYFKPVMAALTTLGVAVTVEDVQFMEDLRGGTAAAMVPVMAGAAGATLAGFAATVAAVGTLLTSTTRNVIVGLFQNVDEDDDTGLMRLFSWAEDLWSFFGLWFLILFPLVMLALIGLAMGLVFLLRWWAHRKEEASRVPCGNCQGLMYRCAMACGHCGAANPQVCDVGIFGQSDKNDPADLATQPLQLAEAKRCPVCATKLEVRHRRQACPLCGHALFADPEFVRAYVRRISHRVPSILMLCGILGLVWIIGVIPAVILYRLALVAPLRRYVPKGRNRLMKWGLRLAFLVLLTSQIVPFLGLITVPVMGLMSFLVYRQMFLCLADDEPAERCGEVSPVAPAAS